MYTVLLVLHIFVAAALVLLVLLQHGKGADMGAAFGSGASGTVFGARGSANFLSRSTAILATVFFISSLTLAWMGSRQTAPSSVIDMTGDAPAQQAPATPDLPPQPTQPVQPSSDVPAQPAQPEPQASEAPAQPAQPDVPAQQSGDAQ